MIADGLYYETLGGSFIAHTDNEWEAIRPEVWRDVTNEVRERHSYGSKLDQNHNAGDFMTHEITDLAKLTCGGRYRIRKMKVGLGAGELARGWAFIVEKREP